MRDRLSLAGVEITEEMVARIAKACGSVDYRYDRDEVVVERVIWNLLEELKSELRPKALREPKNRT